MKKEPANPNVVGTKKTTGAVHHVKSVSKRVTADVEEKKRKAGGIMASAPTNMPLAVVVVEVQTSQNVKGKVGVESKVKKKSVTVKTTSVPVKKVRSPSPKKTTTEESSKTKQAKPKKVISTPIKTPKLKATKKTDVKKPPKAVKAKSEKPTKKQKLVQEKQQQASQLKKQHSTPNETVPTSPITVVISEQDGNDKSTPVSCKKSAPAKPTAKKQPKTATVKKLGVAAGKIGKRKNIIKKTVIKEIGKAFKSDSEKKKDTEKSSESTTDQAPSDINETNQSSKKAITNKKTKNDDVSTAPNLDLSSTTIIDKSKTISKNVKMKATDKPKIVKTKKNTKARDEQNAENKDDGDAKNENDFTEIASKAESKKKEKAVKITKSKVVIEKKNTTDSKDGSKKEEAKTKKPKPDLKSSTNQQKKAKSNLGTVAKMKKAVKTQGVLEKQPGEEKSKEPSDHNDSSTSDELPLELIKRQQKSKPQNQSDKAEEVIKPVISVKEEKIAFEECVNIKEEMDDLYDFKSSDGDCKLRDELIKEEAVKQASEKKGIKSTNKDDTPQKVLKKKVVKKPAVKSATVKVGVKGKASANTKAAKMKAAKASRKVSSDDGGKSDDQESSDDAKKNKKLKKTCSKSGSDSEKRARRMKLFGFWSGPKKHRVASLNALAKVHCLYENESRVMEKAMIEMSETSSPSSKQPASKASEARASEAKASKEKTESKPEKVEESLATTRTLRSNPGLRSVGRHYDILNASSTTSSFTSSDDSSDGAEDMKKLQLQPSVKQKQQNRVKKQQEKQQQKPPPKPKIKPKQIMVSTDGTSEEEDQKDKKAATSSSSSSSENPDGSRKVKKRRKRNELMMDLKDMVVRKRMASLNASAILAASYSMEKRSSSSSNTRKEDSEEDSSRSSRPERKRKSKTSSDSSPDMEVEDSSCEEDVLIRGGGSKQKVAVIVNQDTDLTITGVYVNSTTRSTHHEGFCSIAGMQYRISSTSHTQTEATAVATETVLHTDHPASVREPTVVAQPGKSYTPLGALSSMQPPGHGHRGPRVGPPSPLARRPPGPPHHAPCSSTSAFSAPPPAPQDPAYVHGYYQPAGPLISHHHHHHSTTTTSSSTSKLPPSASPPPPPSAAPTESSDQADSVVASGSGSQPPPPEPAPPVAYRYPPYHGYQYYPSPPASSLQYPPQPQSHYHQEICYSSPNPYPPYFPSSSHKSAPYPPPTYHRRYVPPPQYYTHQEFYTSGGSGSSSGAPAPPPPTSSSSSSSYPPSGAPPPDPGYPPPPPPPAPMVDGYHPPPPTYPYPAYSTGPPPPCYSHSPPNRLAFIDGPTYQGCPCPMQSCPKNVYTGPLTGASKGSLKNHQSTTAPLPPVALALPLEPPGAVGPPSPARGSAGMPPPPSPALATARNPNLTWSANSPPLDTKTSAAETGLLVISKVVTDSVLGIPDSEANCAAETLMALKESSILMPDVKIEVEDTMTTYTQQDIAAAVDLKTMSNNCRKRRRLNGSMIEVRRLSTESVVNLPENLQKTRPLTEVQERLVPCDLAANLKEVTTPNSLTESEDDVENRLPTPPPTSASPTVPVLPRVKQQQQQHHHPQTTTKRKVTEAGCELSTTTTTSTTPIVNSISKCNAKKRKAESAPVKETKKKCTAVNINNNKVVVEQAEVKVEVEPEVKSTKRKITDRRKSTSADRVKVEPTPTPEVVTSEVCEEVQVSQPKKVCRGRKSLEKSSAPKSKRKNVPKNNSTAKGSKKDASPNRSAAKKQLTSTNGVDTVDEIEEPSQIICNPKKTHPVLKWSNGWSWEGTPFMSKVFLTSDDVPVIRKCYPSMRHKGGDIISPRDCVLLKSGKGKQDLPFVAKVAALWENPEDGEMMMSLLWYYRPEHTDRGRRAEDNVDEIFASRHKDINSVACIEDKCFVLTFNEYCRYRKSVRRCEEGLTATSRVVPMLDGSAYPRLNRQPPGQVASDLVFFCCRVYDFRQRRLLKNPS